MERYSKLWPKQSPEVITLKVYGQLPYSCILGLQELLPAHYVLGRTAGEVADELTRRGRPDLGMLLLCDIKNIQAKA